MIEEVKSGHMALRAVIDCHLFVMGGLENGSGGLENGLGGLEYGLSGVRCDIRGER